MSGRRTPKPPGDKQSLGIPPPPPLPPSSGSFSAASPNPTGGRLWSVTGERDTRTWWTRSRNRTSRSPPWTATSASWSKEVGALLQAAVPSYAQQNPGSRREAVQWMPKTLDRLPKSHTWGALLLRQARLWRVGGQPSNSGPLSRDSGFGPPAHQAPSIKSQQKSLNPQKNPKVSSGKAECPPSQGCGDEEHPSAIL